MIIMFVLARVTLVACVILVVNGEDNGQMEKQIVDGIKPTSSAMEWLYSNAFDESRGFVNALELNEKLSDVGQRLFPNLTDFAASFIMLNIQLNERDSGDQNINYEMNKIKDSFSRVERLMVNNKLVPQIKDEVIRQRFNSSIKDVVNQLQKVFIEFVDMPDIGHKKALTETCNTTNAMKDVLTDLHTEIVEGGIGTFNELLDGGIQREMQVFEKWANAILAIYMQASLLRSACFPLIHQDNQWKKELELDLKIRQKNFEQITETVKQKLIILEKDRMSNAYRALPAWFDKYWDDNNNFMLMKHTYLYLNDNFGYGPTGNFTKLNVVVVGSTDVYYRSPDLFYYNKTSDRSVSVGLGKMWPKYNCDEHTGSQIKKLTCFKIGDSHISYHGEQNKWFTSLYYDEHE